MPAFLIATLALAGSAQAAVGAQARSSVTARTNAASHARVNPETCKFTNGKTSNLKLSPLGPAPVGGTVFTFPSGTSCKDLNLSFVSATDGYEGWLQNSHTGAWSHCKAGFVHIKAGHQSTTNPPVLCTGVLAGTKMAVVQESNTQRSITVED
jgi:hypothetical protein